MEQPSHHIAPRFRWLPPLESRKFHLLLGAIAILILGPLGGITAAFMNFSLGFFVGGQVLAGILGSAVTFGYGSEGKHGANYMQTLAASVASMAGMAVLIQAMHWLGLALPDAWKLMLYYLCIGMFGVGVGMLYTPLLVDKMRLTYPSGFAVANILRALTDKALLKMSIGKLALGAGLGLVGGFAGNYIPFIGATSFSAATVGAGMVVMVRIALPAIIVGVIGELLVPHLVASGWLEEGDPFRKIGFVIALGMILGAAIVDLTLVFRDFFKQLRSRAVAAAPVVGEDWKQVNTRRLLLWVAFWGTAVFLVATQVFDQQPLYVLVAIGLVFVFMIVNGISLGISDSNPISSAFVLTVFLLAGIGLADAIGGLITASILLISVSVGGDMQQDRSTGWRLGTNRVIQFRYQVVGIAMGAVLAVGMATVFTDAFPVLKQDQTSMPKAERDKLTHWQSAMTYKFVGALDVFIGRPEADRHGPLSGDEQAMLDAALKAPSLALVPAPAAIDTLEEQRAYVAKLSNANRLHKKDIQKLALLLGVSIGLLTEILRKLIKKNQRFQYWKASSKVGYATDFVLDTMLLPSPYASSFGGFVELPTSIWFGLGGTFSSLTETLRKKHGTQSKDANIPEDMSTNSLIGGGLIAGESLAFLFIGLAGLLGAVL